MADIIFTISLTGTSSQAHRYSTCFLTNPAPATPTITLAGSDLTTASAITYQWYMNGVLISGATSQNYTPTQSGIYVVRTTDVNGCVNAYSLGYTYSVATDIEKLEGKNISIFPNPSTGIIDIDFNYQNIHSLQVMLYDSFGKIVYSKDNTSRVDLSELTNGIYSMSITVGENNPVFKKIVITK